MNMFFERGATSVGDGSPPLSGGGARGGSLMTFTPTQGFGLL